MILYIHSATRRVHVLRLYLPRAVVAAVLMLQATMLYGQSGLRDSLERLDRNQNGKIDPDEITPLARPYLERIGKTRRLSLDRPNGIEKWQEAARIYHAFQNGVKDDRIVIENQGGVLSFGAEPDEPLIPEFGLAGAIYPYTQADLDEADGTLRRYDRNRDGSIDRDEAQRAKWTHRDPFEQDSNRDGKLNRLELAQRYARRRLVSNDSGELIKKAIRVGNGIAPANDNPKSQNRRNWWEQRDRYYLTSSVLGRFDLNKNGQLDPAETTSLGIPISRIDANRDGTLSREELNAHFTMLQDEAGDIAQGLPTWFYERDLDRDGQVSMSEFTEEWTEELMDEFTQLDMNDDGLLTTFEVVRSKAMVGGSYVSGQAEVLAPRKSTISEIVVDEDYPIGNLKVQLSITHTNVSSLDGYLMGPDGQRIELFTGVGGSDDHFNDTVFDDDSRYPITKARPPFEGTFIPEGALKRQPSLSYFRGQSVKGVWQLVISGTRNDRFGMLHHWALLVEPQEQFPGAEVASDPQP
ncbi:EF hand [Novipirellula aureliae]|uniref:EF hand n=1 Tax=Novipirellula aureliae TaxID=2527966 RepID=A0A5C6E2W2_9BACT|nr:proprotein convertase P-domain-containing protein [Novipirellula aureliae]TWU43198.1 EF hand [Novipirellula aureliae]